MVDVLYVMQKQNTRIGEFIDSVCDSVLMHVSLDTDSLFHVFAFRRLLGKEFIDEQRLNLFQQPSIAINDYVTALIFFVMNND